MSATAMTPEQQQQQAAAIRAQKIRAYLEMNFARDPNPAPAAVQAIASQIGESRDAVHNWFIQRRTYPNPGVRLRAIRPDASCS